MSEKRKENPSSDPLLDKEKKIKSDSLAQIVDLISYYLKCLTEEITDKKLFKKLFLKPLEDAVAEKHPAAQYLLARCYYSGVGVDKDFDEALRLLNLAGH